MEVENPMEHVELEVVGCSFCSFRIHGYRRLLNHIIASHSGVIDMSSKNEMQEVNAKYTGENHRIPAGME